MIGRTRKKPKGAALLLEAVFAIGLIGLSIGVFFLLYQRNLQRSTQSKNLERAAFFAERLQAEALAWSRNHHQNHGFDDWGSYQSGTFTDPNFPGFKLTTTVEDHVLDSPCSTFEAVYPNPADRRRIARSSKKLSVQVSWGDQSYETATIIALPNLSPHLPTLTLTPGSDTSLNTDQNLDLTAGITDTPRVDEFSDLKYRWRVVGNGNGTLVVDHHTQGARFSNFLDLPPDNRKYYTGMQCQVEARARYAGHPISVKSGVLELAR